jgi:hypothetical protein
MDYGVGRFGVGIAGEGEAILPPREIGPVVHRPSLRLISALAVLALFGCGLDPVAPGEPPPVKLPPLEFVGGLAGISRVADSTGNARYLGEIVNHSDQVACNIGVAVNSYDVSGALLSNPGNQQFGFANLLGETFRFSASTVQTIETCLSPGHQASFDIRNDFFLNRVERIEASTTCDGTLFDGCAPQEGQPFAYPVAVLGIEGSVTQGVTSQGLVVYTGTIRNQSSSSAAPTYHVKIMFTARNAAGLVVDVACATIDGTVCPSPAGSAVSSVGLGPGDSWTFSVPMSIVPGETCSDCFSYIINQNPSP